MWMTRTHPTGAFYLLPARMWEFAIGGLVAVGGTAWSLVAPDLRGVAGWVGMAGVATAVVTFDESVAFPGSAALLPVLGTALVVVSGGSDAASFAPVNVLRHRSLQWIGRRSYAIYLWHWPALVLAEAKWGPLSLAQRAVAIGVAVALAAASLRLVEDPVRHSPWVAARPGRGLALGAALCATVLVTGAMSLAVPAPPRWQARLPPLRCWLAHPRRPSRLRPKTTPVVGALGRRRLRSRQRPLTGADLAGLIAANRAVLEQGLTTSAVPSNMRPSLAKLFDDRPAVYADGCVAIGVDDQLNPCRYGEHVSSIKVVLFGDSHAAQWFPPLQTIAERNGLELIVLAKGGCPAASVSIPTATLARTCPIWRDKAVQFIADEHPDLVIVTGSRHYPNTDEEWRDGFDTTLASAEGTHASAAGARRQPRLARRPGDVPVRPPHRRQGVRQQPRPRPSSPASSTSSDRSPSRTAHASSTPRIGCAPPPTCPVIIGDILMFRDINHLTTYCGRVVHADDRGRRHAVSLGARVTQLAGRCRRIIASMRRLFDHPTDHVTVREAYDVERHRDPAGRPWVGVCMVASIDGSTVVDTNSRGPVQHDRPGGVVDVARPCRRADRRRGDGSHRGVRSATQARPASRRGQPPRRRSTPTSRLFTSGAGFLILPDDAPPTSVDVGARRSSAMLISPRPLPNWMSTSCRPRVGHCSTGHWPRRT